MGRILPGAANQCLIPPPNLGSILQDVSKFAAATFCRQAREDEAAGSEIRSEIPLQNPPQDSCSVASQTRRELQAQRRTTGDAVCRSQALRGPAISKMGGQI